MLNITGGKLIRPQKVVIYGSEGIGKTTFAAVFPDPLFIDTEGGTAQMDVKRLDKPESWEALVSLVEEVSQNPGICGSLVLDTADWAEQVCIKDLCARYKKSGIEEFGYSKGYTYVSEEFSKLLTACDKVIVAGMNVVITAHAKMRKFEQLDEMGAYDRWEMKLTRQVAPLLKEWSDMLLFCNYKTFVVTPDEGKNKVQGGKRVIYTSHHPCWDAKNRHGLPDEMNMEYANIAHMLNLHATFTKGTIEFRLFQFDAPLGDRQNGLHAGQLKSYIQLCLALSQMAKTVKTASPNPQQTENPKYAMRTWLLRLGFIGEEFATARDLLTRRLAGDAAFRNGRAA